MMTQVQSTGYRGQDTMSFVTLALGRRHVVVGVVVVVDVVVADVAAGVAAIADAA